MYPNSLLQRNHFKGLNCVNLYLMGNRTSYNSIKNCFIYLFIFGCIYLYLRRLETTNKKEVENSIILDWTHNWY